MSRTFRLTVLLLALALVAGAVLSRVKVAKGQTVAQTLLFTWTGDDGNVGTCSGLELRWSAAAIAGTDTLTWWNNATRYTGAYPTPKPAGTPDSVIVLGLPNSTQLRAIVRAFDEVPNLSGFSNVATFTTKDFVPPGRITDLRVGLLDVPDAEAGPGAAGAAALMMALGARTVGRTDADTKPPAAPLTRKAPPS